MLLLESLLAGCKTHESPDQAVKSVLAQKYDENFEHSSLIKKDGGAFRTADYYGRAWPEGQWDKSFDVMVTEGLNKVYDNRFILDWIPEIEKIAYCEAKSVFDTPSVFATVSLYLYEDPGFDLIEEKDITQLLEMYTGSCDLYLIIDQEQICAEKLEALSQALSQRLYGYIHVFASEELPEDPSFKDILEAAPVSIFSIGCSKSGIHISS